MLGDRAASIDSSRISQGSGQAINTVLPLYQVVVAPSFACYLELLSLAYDLGAGKLRLQGRLCAMIRSVIPHCNLRVWTRRTTAHSATPLNTASTRPAPEPDGYAYKDAVSR